MILGIDLGTTNSSCAIYDGHELILVPNEHGATLTPSVVAFHDNEILVGESAKNQAYLYPQATFKNTKRLMGSSIRLTQAGGTLIPEEVAAHILRRLKRDAESFLNTRVEDAVVTVPAYFTEGQRRATREAGGLAGLRVRRLLNEPTAAAIAWAWTSARRRENTKHKESSDREKYILVYDLGGGAFDATVLALHGRVCRVLATSGDSCLGGMDFDALLLKWAASRATISREGFEQDTPLGHRLLDLIERAKIELSLRESVELAFPKDSSGLSGAAIVRIDRHDLETLVQPYVDRSMEKVMEALRSARLAPSSIDHVVLSGGSSRLSLVRRRLRELIGRDAEAYVNPEEIVAKGAALVAHKLIHDEGFKLRDVVSRSFGVEIDKGDYVVLVEKNSPLPLKRKRLFTTIADGQDTVEIHVLQGDADKASLNCSLGRFILSGIRSGKRGEARIELEFYVDNDEILRVAAHDLDTGAIYAVTLLGSSSCAAPSRIASLAERLVALEPYADDDPSFGLELKETLNEASAYLDKGSSKLIYGMKTKEADSLAMIMETLIAELEARRDIKRAAAG